MDKKDFIFKRSWLEYVAGLQPRVRLDVYEAIISYSLDGTVGSLGQAGRAAFMPIKKEIDAYNALSEKRNAISAKRKEAQRIGAENRKKRREEMARELNEREANERETRVRETFTKFTNENFVNSADNAPECSQNAQSSMLKAESLARAIEVNQDNIDDNKNIISKKKKENAEKKDKEDVDNSNFKIQNSQFDVRKFIDFFNITLEHAGAVIPHRCVPTEKRKQALQARVREHGKAALKTMVEKAAASSFLNGGNDRAWVANIDWLLRPNNFVKVIEGNYDAIQNSKLKIQNGYGKTQQSDCRRGVAAQKHNAEEY